MDIITSHSNQKIKCVRALKQPKQRQKSGLFIVEGIYHVGEAIAAAEAGFCSLESIFYAPDLLKSDFALDLVHKHRGQELPCYATTVSVFESIAIKENPQGILAVVSIETYSLATLSPKNFPWGIALVAPQDPGNVGSILRTIDAVGVNGLLLLDSSVDPYHPNVVRASMGALFWYPVVRSSFTDFIGWARKYSYHIIGTSAHGNVDYHQVERYHSPLILLMGSEREGLSHDQVTVCDSVVRMPMQGRVTSLNLAVATGVISYAILEKLRV